MVQNFIVFVDRLASVKIRTTKFSSAGLGGNSAKFCTSENFPPYGIPSFSMSRVYTEKTGEPRRG